MDDTESEHIEANNGAQHEEAQNTNDSMGTDDCTEQGADICLQTEQIILKYWDIESGTQKSLGE